MTMPCILLAAGIDWLETLLPLLFVGFWILSQVFAVFRRIAGGPRPEERVREIQRPRPAAPAAGPDARDELQKQIEEFLKNVVPGESREASRRPVEQKKPALAKPRAVPPPLQPGAAKTGSPRREPVPATVAQPAAQRRVGALETTASDVERHVHDAFAHELSHLAPGLESPGRVVHGAEAGAGPRPSTTTAQDLVKAARNPVTVRQAILLREILDRPVDRW